MDHPICTPWRPASFDLATAAEFEGCAIDADGFAIDMVELKGAKRGSKAGGWIIYDEEGIERGGCVTFDTGSNAILTRECKYRQAAMFIAGPDDENASALRLWAQGNSIEMRADSNGARLSIADARGITYQQPIVALSKDTRVDYQQLEQQYPGKRICESRFTESACRACLDKP